VVVVLDAQSKIRLERTRAPKPKGGERMTTDVEREYQAAWESQFRRSALKVAADRAADRRRDTRALLTVDDAAARLKVTDRTVRNLITRGELPTVKIPGTTNRRIHPADVDALIAAGREAR
jgi:excisionase family DNA binding protein